MTAPLRRNSLTRLLRSSHTSTGEVLPSPSQRWDHPSPSRTKSSSSITSEATLMVLRVSLRTKEPPAWRGITTCKADLLLRLPRSASSDTSFRVLSDTTTPWVALQATTDHTLLPRHTANTLVAPPTDHPCRITRMEYRAYSLLRLFLTPELVPLPMSLAPVLATPSFFDKTTAMTLR